MHQSKSVMSFFLFLFFYKVYVVLALLSEKRACEYHFKMCEVSSSIFARCKQPWSSHANLMKREGFTWFGSVWRWVQTPLISRPKSYKPCLSKNRMVFMFIYKLKFVKRRSYALFTLWRYICKRAIAYIPTKTSYLHIYIQTMFNLHCISCIKNLYFEKICK